jgi:hypothetical protein
MLPLIATFRRPREQRRFFAAYTAGVAFCIAMTTFHSFNLCIQLNPLLNENISAEKTAQLKSIAVLTGQWLQYSVWGIAISTWLSAGASVAPMRR